MIPWSIPPLVPVDTYTGKWLAGWGVTDSPDGHEHEESFDVYTVAVAFLLKELNWIGCDSGGKMADQALAAGNRLANRTDFVPQSYAFEVGDYTYYLMRAVELNDDAPNSTAA